MFEKNISLENRTFNFDKWLTNQTFSILDTEDCIIQKMYCYYSKELGLNVYVNFQDNYACSIYKTTLSFSEIKSDYFEFQEKCQHTLVYKGIIPFSPTFAETLFSHLLNKEYEE